MRCERQGRRATVTAERVLLDLATGRVDLSLAEGEPVPTFVLPPEDAVDWSCTF